MCETKSRVSTVCEDIQVTLCLPSDVVNVEPESIADFAELNRQKYEKAIEDVRADVDLVDSFFEKEAQGLKDIAVEELGMITQGKPFRDLSNITDAEQWTLAHAASKKLNTQILGIVNEYDEDLKSLEVKRKNQTTEILLKYKEKFTKIGLLDYNKVREIFQDEIDSINSKTVSNLRRIADFNLDLQVRGKAIKDTINHNLKDKAKYISEQQAEQLWRKLIKKQNKKLLEDTVDNLTQKNYQIRDDIVQVINNLLSSCSNFTNIFKLSMDTIMEDSKLWEYWIGKLKSRLEVFDEKSNDLATHLKAVIETLMNNFDNHINVLNTLLLTKLEEYDNLSLNSSTDTRVLNINQDEETEELKRTVSVVFEIIDSKIKQLSTFLDDIKSIWTNYLRNINDMHKQLNNEWKAFNAIYAKLKTDLTSKIKTQTKNIREAKDLDKLNSISNDLEKIINTTEEKLNTEYDSRISSLLNLKNKNVEKILEQKLSSITNFLNVKHQKSTWLHENIENDSANLEEGDCEIEYQSDNFNMYMNEVDNEPSEMHESTGSYETIENDCPSHQSDNCEIGHQIENCNMHMIAVDNGALGMYEVLEECLDQCKVDVVKECDEWFKTFLEDVISMYNFDVADFLNTQRTVIKDPKNIRSAELIYHSDRLQSHSHGVKAVISQLNQEFNDVKIKKQSLLSELKESKTRLIQDSPTDSSKQIKFVITELENQLGSLKETLENGVSEAKEQCIKRFGIVEHSNELFLKTAKIFKNGGNYSPEEIKILNKELKQLEKECTSQKKNLLKKYNDLLSGPTRESLGTEIDKLKEKLDNFTLKEILNEEITKLRFNLRTEVENMKNSGRRIDKSIKSISSLSKIDKKIVYDLIQMMNQRYDYMTFPPEMSSFENLYSNDNQKDSGVDSKYNTPSKQEKSKKLSDSKSSTLFLNVSDQDITIADNYFAKTKGVMMKKYKSLNQHLIDKFMSTATNTQNSKLKNKQKPESEAIIADYMKQIKSVFLNYNKECELPWFFEAKLLIGQITSLRKCISSIIKRELKLKYEEYELLYKCLQKEYQYEVETKQKKQMIDREKIQNTLKLPLAHPNHQQKLTELLKKASTLCETQKIEFGTVVNELKEDLQCTHDEYVEEMKNLKADLTHIQSFVNDQLLIKLDDLIGKVESVSDLVQSDVNRSDKSSIDQSDNEDKCEYPKSIWSTVDSSSYCSSLKSSSVSGGGENEDERECLVISNATELVKQSAELIQKLYDEAKLCQIKNEKLILAWLKNLKRNANQCKLVFKL